MRFRPLRPSLWFLLCLAGFTGCPRAPSGLRGIPAGDRGRVEALLINGGSRPEKNVHSHLMHLRRLSRLLIEAGVPERNITVLASDGQDPAPDVAMIGPDGSPDAWLLEGTRLGNLLRPEIRYVNSSVDGLRLLPARRASVETWFHTRGRDLRAGDTLLLYVTDHGIRTHGKEADTFIVLWRERLSTRDFAKLLDDVDPGVRVVLWMSQCYSGAFARTMYREDESLELRGNVCGFFSTLPDRQAWGCYPEALSDAQGRGHSHRFLDALGPGARLAAAHDRVLVLDGTPNVPHSSSMAYLRRLLETEAADRKVPRDKLGDELLRDAWRDTLLTARYRPVLEALAGRLQVPVPRSLRDLARVEKDLKRHARRSAQIKRGWRDCLRGLAQAVQKMLVEGEDAWKARTLPELRREHGLAGGDPDADDDAVRLRLGTRLVEQTAALVQAEPALSGRFARLRPRYLESGENALRMQQREGLVLRMRLLLESMAGDVLAARNAGWREALEVLRTCEGWRLPGEPGEPPSPRSPGDLPPLDQDVAALEALRPAWLGVRYRVEDTNLRRRHGLAEGAVVVLSVVPGSPAQQAGIQAGDTIVGNPGDPFLEDGALKERVMQAAPGKPFEMEILREGERRTVSVCLEPFPENLPAQPARLEKDQPAPALAGLQAYRGELPGPGTRTWLMFFATWCGPCKKALADLNDLERRHAVPIVVVTSEPTEIVEKFFAAWTDPLPPRIALDPRGLVSEAFRARSFPTFVLVGADGKVEAVRTGYNREKGLVLP